MVQVDGNSQAPLPGGQSQPADRTAGTTAEIESRPQMPFPWGQLISFYSAFTYFMLGIDMVLLHLGYQHYHFMAVAPIIFCLFAAIVSFLSIFSPWLRRHAWTVGVLTMVVGITGTIIHLELAYAALRNPTFINIWEHLIFDPRPPLAPAALAGTGLLMIFVSLAERWPIPWLQFKRFRFR